MNGTTTLWPTFSPRDTYYALPGIASVTCLEFRIDQWEKVQARSFSKQ